MKFNTAVDFIQTSGGNVDHVHHAKLLPLGDDFLPEGSSPTLPSGSIWFRPNNGQAERLQYQGEDTTFQIRAGEGIANYIVNKTQDLPLDFTFDETLIEDSRFFTLINDEEVMFHVSGIYRITMSVRGDNTDNDGDILTWVSREPDGVGFFLRGTNYAASNGDDGGGHVFWSNIVYMQRGESIQPHVLGGGGSSIDLEVCSLIVEFIRPINRGESNVII